MQIMCFGFLKHAAYADGDCGPRNGWVWCLILTMMRGDHPAFARTFAMRLYPSWEKLEHLAPCPWNTSFLFPALLPRQKRTGIRMSGWGLSEGCWDWETRVICRSCLPACMLSQPFFEMLVRWRNREICKTSLPAGTRGACAIHLSSLH